jgi:hypothetical protein
LEWLGVDNGVDIKEVLKKIMLVICLQNTVLPLHHIQLLKKEIFDGSTRWVRHGGEVVNEEHSVIT